MVLVEKDGTRTPFEDVPPEASLVIIMDESLFAFSAAVTEALGDVGFPTRTIAELPDGSRYRKEGSLEEVEIERLKELGVTVVMPVDIKRAILEAEND